MKEGRKEVNGRNERTNDRTNEWKEGRKRRKEERKWCEGSEVKEGRPERSGRKEVK